MIGSKVTLTPALIEVLRMGFQFASEYAISAEDFAKVQEANSALAADTGFSYDGLTFVPVPKEPDALEMMLRLQEES